MSDLISRQAAIDGINELMKVHFDRKFVLGKARTIMQELPPIQPKRGKWNRLGRDVFNCNKCGATFVLNQGGEKMRFCPNCGADMRQKGENSESD